MVDRSLTQCHGFGAKASREALKESKYSSYELRGTFVKFLSILSLVAVLSGRFCFANPSQEYLFDASTAYWKSQALYLVAKLKVADQMKSGSVSVDQLAKILKVKSEPLYRILRALASDGVFVESDGKTFKLGERGFCLRSDVPCSLRNSVVMYGGEQAKAWGQLEVALTEEKTPFEKTFGVPVFKYFKENAEAASVFNSAMKELGTQVYSNSEIVSAYDFSKYPHIIDLGGGNGSFLKTILSQSATSLRGTLFETSNAIKSYTKGNETISLMEGDFFKEVPKGGDLYIWRCPRVS